MLTRGNCRYVFAEFQLSIQPHFVFNDAQLNSQYKTIPTFLTLFVFAFIYELILVWDALRSKNTIQIIGLSTCNLALLAYTALQIDQIGNAIDLLEANGAIVPGALGTHDVWLRCRPFLIAIPCIIAVATVAMAYTSWQLYKEFAWDILKQIGADYRMKKRFLHYQVSSSPKPGSFILAFHFILTRARSTSPSSNSTSSSSSASRCSSW